MQRGRHVLSVIYGNRNIVRGLHRLQYPHDEGAQHTQITQTWAPSSQSQPCLMPSARYLERHVSLPSGGAGPLPAESATKRAALNREAPSPRPIPPRAGGGLKSIHPHEGTSSSATHASCCLMRCSNNIVSGYERKGQLVKTPCCMGSHAKQGRCMTPSMPSSHADAIVYTPITVLATL